MNYGTIESYQGRKWNIDGNDCTRTLKEAKAAAVDLAIERRSRRRVRQAGGARR